MALLHLREKHCLANPAQPQKCDVALTSTSDIAEKRVELVYLVDSVNEKGFHNQRKGPLFLT
ncbi:MAG: hypothetical protein M0Z94_12345 [Dehalococcoidales bacterium]|nr:hypothetical protein [Dehalococcoidales bacterium]